ncbi:DUF262 domain-containing protein [Paenibacillus sp. D51F]
MIQPEPQSTGLNSLIADISSGRIKVPQFQREYVWEMKAAAQLLDSIAKGFPIGTFIMWETQEELRSIRNIGNHNLPSTPQGHTTQYILDGQQRITSMYTCFKGLTFERDGKVEDFSEIFIDLYAGDDDEIVTVNIDDKTPERYIKVTELLYGKMSTLLKRYSEASIDKIDKYKERFTSYQFSQVILRNAPIDVATEVFTRLNVGGKTLTLFEIMVAKTYDQTSGFDLSEKYEELLNELGDNYKTIAASTVLQVISCVLKKDCTRKQILKLDKKEFIGSWDSVKRAIIAAVDYFKSYFRIPVSRILPYDALIVPFAYFFYHHKQRPLDDKRTYLQDFFWRSSLSERYSSGVESKLGQDLKRIDQILAGKLPTYDYDVNVSPERIIEQGEFSTGRSFIKAILALFASFEPQSFADGAKVHIDNAWLQIATSKNYHHFFPKAYLKRIDKDYLSNHIVNITIVDDFLNKQVIRDNAPSKYMGQFKAQNKKLDDVMNTHLIDLNDFGVWDDNYDVFFQKRAEKISEELSSRLISQPKSTSVTGS